MAAYLALFEAIEHFNKNRVQKLNVPTLIFMDERDELVSYRELKRIITNRGLHRWTLCPVKKDKTGVRERMHHLIIDESCMGKGAWNEMRRRMIHHLMS